MELLINRKGSLASLLRTQSGWSEFWSCELREFLAGHGLKGEDMMEREREEKQQEMKVVEVGGQRDMTHGAKNRWGMSMVWEWKCGRRTSGEREERNERCMGYHIWTARHESQSINKCCILILKKVLPLLPVLTDSVLLNVSLLLFPWNTTRMCSTPQRDLDQRLRSQPKERPSVTKYRLHQWVYWFHTGVTMSSIIPAPRLF